MADRNGYIGRAPGDSSVIVARQTFQPTGVQTDFTFSSGYDPGYLDVYLNGSRLIVASDYTATDGSVVGLTSYAENGDVLECVAYKAFNLGSINNATGNFDVGVDLTVGNDATITGDLTVSGTTTLGAGASVSYATTAFALENSPNISVNNLTGVAATHSGVVKITDTTASTTTATGALIVSGGVGIAKSLFVGGNISAGGTVSYEDVTNVDSVGVVTAGKGFRATTGGIIVTAGVVTATDGVVVSSGSSIGIGTAEPDNELHVFGATTAAIRIETGDGGYNPILMQENPDRIWHTGLRGDASDSWVVRDATAASNRLVIDTSGDVVVGSAITMYASAGIVSATSFYGDGSNLEGVAASGGGVLDITSCLFV